MRIDEDILQAIWPDVHVGGDVLKVAIAEIRRALEDSSREPRFVETAHRRGYRFIARTDRMTAGKPREPSVPPTRYARSGDLNIADDTGNASGNSNAFPAFCNVTAGNGGACSTFPAGWQGEGTTCVTTTPAPGRKTAP